MKRFGDRISNFGISITRRFQITKVNQRFRAGLYRLFINLEQPPPLCQISSCVGGYQTNEAQQALYMNIGGKNTFIEEFR